MITNFIIEGLLGILGALLYFLPVVTIEDIPVIGSTISTILVSWIQTWNSIIITVPYLYTAWFVFLVVIIPFELVLLGTKIFLAHRVPVSEQTM